MSTRQFLSNHLVNFKGATTNRKIVVFESDDWGSIRMPSVNAYESMLKEGIRVDKSPYCINDNLCSSEDVEMLFDVLKKYKAVITANAVVANPDFEKIKASGFETYSYEKIDKTFERYFPNDNPMNVWKEGMKENIFIPQFHGREHVNVPFWLDKLKNNDPVFTKAFEHHFWGISSDVYNKYPKSVQASFDYGDESELDFMAASLTDGLKIFEELFGYKSRSFIPNNYTWPSSLDKTLTKNGIEIIQGMKYQLLPKPNGETQRKMARRFNGQMKNGLLQTVRNAQFEPSLLPENKRGSAVKNTVDQIAASFFWKKPAVISVHRINFCGSLHRENRDANLKFFSALLHEITKRWPDAEFMDTVSLANIK